MAKTEDKRRDEAIDEFIKQEIVKNNTWWRKWWKMIRIALRVPGVVLRMIFKKR
jgi:hypothetical protein